MNTQMDVSVTNHEHVFSGPECLSKLILKQSSQTLIQITGLHAHKGKLVRFIIIGRSNSAKASYPY